jgi:uncharacterized membrane protein
MPDSQPDVDSRDLDRLLLFSDAVVAIAITLLALELPVPSGRNAGELWRSARHDDGRYFAFLVSFIVIAVMWTHHRQVFRYATRCDDRLVGINTFWLLTIVLNPSATKLLTGGDHDTVAAHALRFGCYALIQALAVTSFLVMVHRLVAQGFLSADAPPFLRKITDDASYGLLAGFALSIPVFFATRYGWVLWVVMPPLVGRVRRWAAHRKG